MLELKENDLYYFDGRAADRAVKFIETRLCHYEDRWEGKPFLLLDWQRKCTRDLIGWKRRDNDLRRFRETYIEIGKGNGKSPWLSAMGCYLFLADNEAGALVISSATDLNQANALGTFGTAKKMLAASPRLAGMVTINQFEILGPKDSAWRVVSGAGSGKAGMRPTCLLMDEAWEWANRKAYDSLTRNAKKRSQSLALIATNSATTKECICYELHERAERVLNGVSRDDTLYPVIFAASEKDDPGDPETWKKANPAIGEIITIETLQSEYIKGVENPALMAEFLRLHLSLWVGSAGKWLDMALWDKATAPFKISEVQDLPLVLALDMSLNDDLTTLGMIWIGEKRLYAKCRFWLPKKTAKEYEEQASIPFTQWHKEKHIDLIDADTIDPRTQRRLSKIIIKLKAKFPKLVCLTYDRNRASNVIALCEAKDVVCVPVPQNWQLSPAAEELDRRVKDGTIQVHPNPVLRWNASNAEATHDAKGNIHIGKEGRKGKYAGRRGCKIDGVAVLITGISQVLLELMKPPKEKSVYETRGVFVL